MKLSAPYANPSTVARGSRILLSVTTNQAMSQDFTADVERVNRIEAVPTILDVVCRTTGMRFAAVARVTEERWIACTVLDEIDFGLKQGGELKVETTICHEIRQSREPVIINNVAEDQELCGHQTPAMYGFQSYISMPIILADGSFFGTLCAIDPRPARLRTPETIGMFRLFAELIAKSLDGQRKLAVTESALLQERADAELREQFIAVLAHDLRAPMSSIRSLMDLMLKTPLNEDATMMGRLMRDSSTRMLGLIDNMLDLARARLGGGLTVSRNARKPLEPVLRDVIAEFKAGQPTALLMPNSTLSSRSIATGRASPNFSPIFRAISEKGNFELRVTNAGEPIPAAALDHLFHPFYRSAVEHNREGLGLGLYIAHEIATAHGGTLGVESTREETSFTFRMPTI